MKGARITVAALSLSAAGLIGIAVFHGVAQWAPQFGSALPSLLLTFALAWLTRHARKAQDVNA